MNENSKANWESELENDDFIKEYTQNLMKKYNNVTEYVNEEELIDLTLSEVMIVHFYTPSFKKSNFMNNALDRIATKFPNIKFVKIDVKNSPKMCTSLGITVLPFLGFFKNGFIVDYLVGFKKLGNAEVFDLDILIDYIKNSKLQMCNS